MSLDLNMIEPVGLLDLPVGEATELPPRIGVSMFIDASRSLDAMRRDYEDHLLAFHLSPAARSRDPAIVASRALREAALKDEGYRVDTDGVIAARVMRRVRYERLLAEHDWFHQDTSDHSKYVRARDVAAFLMREQKEIDTDCEVWNEHAPVEFKNGRAFR